MTFNLEQTWHGVWQQELNDTMLNSSYPTSEWRAGGRVSKDKPNKEDSNWWRSEGLAFCENWVTWRERSGWRIWEVSGKPAIELGGTVEVGGFRLRAYVDRVFVTPAGELVLLDLKSGARTPEGDFQLGVYAAWLDAQFGVRPQYGCYWLARKGEIGVPVSLDRYTVEYMAKILKMFADARKHQIYMPNVGEHCRRCGVARACYAVGGEESHLYDPLNPEYPKGKQ